jgi:S1-C subfamily serine protease
MLNHGYLQRSTSLLIVGIGILLICCAPLPKKISDSLDRGEFRQARVLLEKEGVGRDIRPNSKTDALEARRIFSDGIETRYISDVIKLKHSGLMHAALSKVEDGIDLVPWSDKFDRLKFDISGRIARVEGTVTKWGPRATSDVSLIDARDMLADIKLIEPDYADTPELISLREKAINALIHEWVNKINSNSYPIGKDNWELFWNDINATGFKDIKSDNYILTLAALSYSSAAPKKPRILEIKDSLLTGAKCIQSQISSNNIQSFIKLQNASKKWLEDWYDKTLPLIVEKEPVTFEAIDLCENVIARLPVDGYPNLKRQVGLFHLRAAEERTGAGASASLSLLHSARTQQLCGDSLADRVKTSQKAAFTSMITGERLNATMGIDSEPTVDPQLYDFVRTAFIAVIRNRTKGYFLWQFLPPGQSDSAVNLVIKTVDFQIPSYENLNTITSQYYDHNENVPNPQKTYLESMLISSKNQLNWAQTSYNNAVSTHNMYPTDYSLMAVNNAYNNYIFYLNAYNNYVSMYNTTPSTISRPVFMPYSFKEGRVQYGWEVRIQYNIGERSGVVVGKSMENGYIRIGTKYNDRDASHRRDEDLQFNISIERTVDHLFSAVKIACDQIAPAISNAIPLKYTSGLSDSEINIVKWFLHPWGRDLGTGKQAGIPQWAIDSSLALELPEIMFKPPDVNLISLSQHPKYPMNSEDAAKYYIGLICKISTDSKEGMHSSSTGAIVSPDGLILTCAHGLVGNNLKIEFVSGPSSGVYDAELVFVNDDSDVALIRARGLRAKRWIEVRLGTAPEKGEEIVAIGNPSLPDGTLSIEAISKGIISNPESEFYGVPRVVADISIASGSSGGPLISLNDGKIIGVVVAVANAELARNPGQRSASGPVCLAAPAKRLTAWLGLHSVEKTKGN